MVTQTSHSGNVALVDVVIRPANVNCSDNRPLTRAPIQALVGNAIASYINSLPIGVGLPLTRLAQIAYSASPAVINVSALQANGSASDIGVSASGVVKAGIIAVD